MCDSFDMACHDASSALQLNIKVNSENLLPNSQKYNVGSLRLPADPSWPKIPQRRLVDDLGEVIEPPCVVTLTGTPRKSRTTVRASHHHSHQPAKSTYSKEQVPASFQNVYHQKLPTPSHPLKRRPGCADPRFKRVTTVKSQMTPSEPHDGDRENLTEQSRSALVIPNQSQCSTENVRRTVPEKDTDQPKVSQREAEKPGQIRRMDSVGVQTIPFEDISKSVDAAKNHTDKIEILKEEYEEPKKIIETEQLKLSPEDKSEDKIECNSMVKKPLVDEKRCEKLKDDEILPMKNSTPQEVQKTDCSKDVNSVNDLTNVPNTRINVQPEAQCLQYCQSNAGQFFLVVENKAQASSLSAIAIDPTPATPCQYTTQCYNVQVPVLSYQNLPLQISTQPPAKVDIPSQLSLTPLQTTLSSSPSLKNPVSLSIDVPNNNFSGSLKEPNINSLKKQGPEDVQNVEEVKNNVLNSVDNEKLTTIPQQPQRTTINTCKNDCRKLKTESSDIEQTRKLLATPPIKLERRHVENYKFEEAQTDSDGIIKGFEKRLFSDTTDSELYGLTTQTKLNRIRRNAMETSCSGSDCEMHSRKRSNFKNDDIAMKKKRRKPIYNSAIMSQEVLYSRHYEDHCLREQESSVDDQESLKPRGDGKQGSRGHRKMKSEQNLPRSSPCEGRYYKNVSDPHITDRGKYISYNSGCVNSRQKHENCFTEDIVDEIKAAFLAHRLNDLLNNQENTDRTVDMDSDVLNVPVYCETHRRDYSNIEEPKNPLDSLTPDKPIILPAKTQQLLNKSYMEYYEKLRSKSIEEDENAQQRYICQMAMGAPQLKKRRAEINGEIGKIDGQKVSSQKILTLEKLSALSNIINRNLNPTEKNSCDTTQTKQLYVNENMKSSSDPTADTQSAVLKRVTAGDSADFYDSSLPSSTLINKVKRKREKPVERRLLKLKTIAFFGFMMYAMIVLLPMMYNYFLYDEYEDYEDLSYIELTLEYVVSSFREAFGGLFDTINDLFFRPRTCRKCNNAA